MKKEKKEKQLETMFVYGTLRQGFGNHSLIKDAIYLGEAYTVYDYALYESGIPFLFMGESVSQIQGEIYAVDRETRNKVDRLEGHPRYYRRELLLVERAETKERLYAWTYTYPHLPRGVLNASGDFAQEPEPVLYFAYGSNMSATKMKQRGMDWETCERAVLSHHRLIFNKQSSTHARIGYANIEFSAGHEVEGILYTLPMSLERLDHFEGHPEHYQRIDVEVLTDDGEPVKAIAYRANPQKIKKHLLPTVEYLNSLLEGRPYLSKSYYKQLKGTPALAGYLPGVSKYGCNRTTSVSNDAWYRR